MVAPAFAYVPAASYGEAVRLLADSTAAGQEAKVLAGGQSLMPMLNLRLAHPDLLIDINPADQRPPVLAEDGPGGLLRLPALTRHRVLLEHDLVRRHCPLLAEAVRYVGNVRVRNRGTVGGSLAHADPTSEIGCCALAAGARVVACGPDGDRTIPAGDLFAGYWTTTLRPAEVITDVLIPVARPGAGWSFLEMARRTSDFAIVAVAVMVNLAERNGAIAAARVALAGVADRVVLADPALVDSNPDETAARIAESLDPPGDVHASGEYRRRVARVLTARALREASARAAR